MPRRLFLTAVFSIFALPPANLRAEPEAAVPSASELASRLSEKQQDGSSYIRLRMEIAGPQKSALQVQIKSRATRAGTELVYQVLWPKERKGEAVLLRQLSHRPPTGTIFNPGNGARSLTAGQMSEPLLGSDLSYEDAIENFFGWEQQTMVGAETVDRVNCQILESKPGKSERSAYTSVRSWIDLRRMVPLKVEKYSGSGRLVRRIETTRVVTDDKGRPIPANLTVRGPAGGSSTELDGSKIKHGATFADEEFTPEGLAQITAAKAPAE